jgi:predicted hydrocarbon binding protein
MVTIHRNYYEDILSGKFPMGEIMIETIAKRPIRDIPPKEMTDLIKKVYEASRIVDKVEIHKDSIILFHTYRNRAAIEKIRKQLIMLLEANGKTYNGEITTNMMVFEYRPDIGIKINEIVNNLKSNESKFDQELITFMAFLKDIDNIADTTTSVSILGRRIGIALMEEYEKENDIKTWDLETFKNAFATIDSKIHRDSEMILDGNSLLYRVRRCNIVSKGDRFDKYICRAAREAFKGAINYVFGNKVDLEIKRLLSHGDNCCEVIIQM